MPPSWHNAPPRASRSRPGERHLLPGVLPRPPPARRPRQGADGDIRDNRSPGAGPPDDERLALPAPVGVPSRPLCGLTSANATGRGMEITGGAGIPGDDPRDDATASRLARQACWPSSGCCSPPRRSAPSAAWSAGSSPRPGSGSPPWTATWPKQNQRPCATGSCTPPGS